MLHFKTFGMINLRYEIRICHKIYNRVTMTVCVKCVVWFNLNKTLVCVSLDSFLNFMNAFLFNYQCFRNKRRYAKSGIVPFKDMTFAILIFEKDDSHSMHCGPPPFLVTKTLHKGGTKSYASLRQLLLPRTISEKVRARSHSRKI